MQADRQWTVPQGAPDALLYAILSTLTVLNWKDVTQLDRTVRARAGSRLAFRIWGAYLPPGRRQFPMRVGVSVDPSPSGPVITMSLTSDEGWYAFTLPIVGRLFEEAADVLCTALENATRWSVREADH